MVLKSSRYLTTPFNNNNDPQIHTNNEDEEEEFNECDIVWSPSSYDNNNNHPIHPIIESNPDEGRIYPALPRLLEHKETIPLPTTTTSNGLSAALDGPGPPKSPTSIQRKTTSSPAISMISSSLTRGGHGDGPGLYGRKYHQSAPVNVPVWPNGLGKKRTSGPQFGLGCFDEVDEEYDDEWVPPHEIVARSHSKTMSFSVMEGAGRTLKGRDLTTVRNAVFHKTGFL